MLNPDYLDEPCPVDGCDLRTGDHPLELWAAHRGTQASFDFGYAPVEGDPVDVALGNRPLADHVLARAGIMEAHELKIPVVMLDFLAGVPGGIDIPRATVAYIGTPQALRRAGTIIRDTFNGAANATAAGPTGRAHRRRGG